MRSALLLTTLSVLMAVPSAMAVGPGPAATPSGLSRPVAVGSAAASPEQIVYLVRATLLALDDANRTGNYSVLRDSAAPSFQRSHSTADLALIFADLRRRGISLTVAAVADPELLTEPTIDAGHVLVLVGALPTAPLRVLFDLRFEAIDGVWRLAALSVGAQPLTLTSQRPARP